MVIRLRLAVWFAASAANGLFGRHFLGGNDARELPNSLLQRRVAYWYQKYCSPDLRIRAGYTNLWALPPVETLVKLSEIFKSGKGG
ncbi:MAG TPA: hypothetical protein VHZ55_09370 [Bryobacteraceae bacterium]|jgi:hypothetical protein|nr:hypothetical protein [Bryobacteraceae bacterium]